MRNGRSLLDWYLATRRAKLHGQWRRSLPACLGIFVLLSPVIMLVEGLACLAVCTAATALALPPLATSVLMGAVVLAVAVILAEVLYFALRNSGGEDDTSRCTSCGYDLTGNVTGVCSECGEPI